MRFREIILQKKNLTTERFYSKHNNVYEYTMLQAGTDKQFILPISGRTTRGVNGVSDFVMNAMSALLLQLVSSNVTTGTVDFVLNLSPSLKNKLFVLILNTRASCVYFILGLFLIYYVDVHIG